MSVFQGNYYYHQITKSFLVAFGSVFDGLHITKRDQNNNTVQDYVVPIDFSPKNKWVLMISERPDFTTNQVQITLPRMAFEVVGFKPSMENKLGFNGTFATGNNLDNTRTKVFNPVPYQLTINLYAMTKDNDDMLQIIEQIIPYFQPSLTMNFNLLPEYGIYKDIPISLLDVQTEDNYTGSAEEQRTVMTTFTFSAPMYYYGPIAQKGSIIKDVKVHVTGGVIVNYEAAITPPTANPGDVHTVTETWNPK